MKLLPSRRQKDSAVAENITVSDAVESGQNKGRPTPKRRESAPRRGPVGAPPRTRKEAVSWQREQAKQTKQNASALGSAPRKGTPEYRELMRRGDPSVLLKRDQGPVRKLARDWVDSRRMLSNWLLLLLIPMLVASRFPILQWVVLAVFVLIILEMLRTGRAVLRLARERGMQTRDTAFGVGFYTLNRAFLPRRWRLPAPTVQRGDTI